MKRIEKDPNATLDYSWDWSDWLGADETIVTASVTVPDGLTLGVVSQLSGVVTAWMSGCTDGTEYAAACRITTSEGRIDERTIIIRCRQR